MQLNNNNQKILLEKLRQGFPNDTEKEIRCRFENLLGSVLLFTMDFFKEPQLYVHEINGVLLEIGICSMETGLKVTYMTNSPSSWMED